MRAPAPHFGVAVTSVVADEKFCVPMDTETKYCAASFSSASSTVSMTMPYLRASSHEPYHKVRGGVRKSRGAGGGGATCLEV